MFSFLEEARTPLFGMEEGLFKACLNVGMEEDDFLWVCVNMMLFIADMLRRVCDGNR